MPIQSSGLPLEVSNLISTVSANVKISFDADIEAEEKTVGATCSFTAISFDSLWCTLWKWDICGEFPVGNGETGDEGDRVGAVIGVGLVSLAVSVVLEGIFGKS